MTDILTNMQTTRSIDLKLHGDIFNGCPAEIAIGNSMQLICGIFRTGARASLRYWGQMKKMTTPRMVRTTSTKRITWGYKEATCGRN